MAAREPTHTAHSGLYEAVERRIGAGEHPASQARQRARCTDSTAREARSPVQAFNSQAIGARCLCPRPMASGRSVFAGRLLLGVIKIFPADGAHRHKRDLPEVEFDLLDTGHFALEDKLDEMAPLIRDFLNRRVG